MLRNPSTIQNENIIIFQIYNTQLKTKEQGVSLGIPDGKMEKLYQQKWLTIYNKTNSDLREIWSQHFINNKRQFPAMMREKPCPFRIVDDLGGGFSMGCLMGAAWHFGRGMYYSPKSEKFFGGIMMMKKRAPILAGSFAMWAGIYSLSECALMYFRNTDDAFNKIASGAMTGGILAMRAGPRIAMKNALIGGIFLGAIVLFEIIMVKYQKRQQLQMQIEQTEQYNKSTRRELAKRRSDLFYPDGTPRVMNSPRPSSVVL